MRNFLVTLSEWAFVAFCSVMMILISMADRFGKKKDGSRSALTEASPQEAERPALPPPVVVHLSFMGRIEKRDRATPEELAALRRGIRKLRDREMIEKAIREVGGC